MRNSYKYTKNIVFLRKRRNFMVDYLYRTLFFFAAILVPIIMPADGLPTLPPAPQVRAGLLDNGITYYIVTNPTERGRADISLVQKGGYGDEADTTAGSSTVNAMGALSGLPHFKSPYRFLTRNCIWPGEDGYVSVNSDATIYKFRRLDLSRSGEMVDSVLLMIFDIIDTQSYTIGGRYTPGNQAIIISGDVDPGAVTSKMNTLSMLVTRAHGTVPVRTYKWESVPDAVYRHVQAGNSGHVSITAEYASPRTPDANMPTVQPLVSQKFASEFGIIVRKRLAKAFRLAGIPVSDIGFSYRNSAEGPEDEKYRITVGTSIEWLESAVSVLSSTLAALDQNGALPEEYRDAQNELMMDLRRDFTGDVVDNSMYVDMCISSYLYGSTLASSQTRLDFFITKNIQNDVGARLFNNFVAALLDRSRNLTLECVADSAAVSGRRVLECFDRSWKPAGELPYVVSRSDTLKIRKNNSKVKIKATVAEPLSGGQMWTMDNGIRVIFKNTPNTGTFRYKWLLKGGFSLLPGLRPGEGAYISDMLSLYDVSGMSCWNFNDMLAANGIQMDCEVTMSDMRIGGAAPSSRLQLLLRSMYALTTDRSMNRAAFDYYRRCNEAGVSSDRTPAEILDSLMFPNNLYSPFRRKIHLSDDFQKRTEKYFENEFSKMNDGVLIIVGDFDELELRKILAKELGGFRTEKVSSLRSKVQHQTLSGRNSMIVDGPSALLEIGFSAPVTFSSSAYMSTFIAAMALEDRISESLASCGWHGDFRWRFDSFPEERFSLFMSAAPSVRTGVPASLLQTDSVEEVMSRVRRVVSDFAARGIDRFNLAVYKATLTKKFDSRMAGPQTAMSMLELRYSCGKDLVTRYGEKIGTVNEDSVNGILRALEGGRRAEYAVKAPVRKIEESHPDDPVSGMEVSRIAPAADSSGVNLEAFRTIGIVPPPSEPYWQVPSNFRRFMAELPSPRVYVPEPLGTRDIMAIAASCESMLGSFDSIRVNEKLDTDIEVPVMQLPDPAEALYRKSFKDKDE